MNVAALAKPIAFRDAYAWLLARRNANAPNPNNGRLNSKALEGSGTAEVVLITISSPLRNWFNETPDRISPIPPAVLLANTKSTVAVEPTKKSAVTKPGAGSV